MRMQKFSRPGVILMATVVAIITSIVVANATQTITTPNAAFISYSLAAGANSAVITPATNRAVLVMGCAGEGVGQVVLQHIPNCCIDWVGLEAFATTITSGVSMLDTPTHIVYISSNHKVDIQTASRDTIRVHNGDSITQAGNVTLIW